MACACGGGILAAAVGALEGADGVGVVVTFCGSSCGTGCREC